MNSESAPKLSMDELKRMNQPFSAPPAPTPKMTPQPIVIQCAMPEAIVEIENRLESLEEQQVWQTEYLRKLSEKPTAYPTQAQMTELLKTAKHLEQMAEQVGKPKEKRFSFPAFHLSLPEWPTVFTLVMTLAAVILLLLWFKLSGDWSSFDLPNP